MRWQVKHAPRVRGQLDMTALQALGYTAEQAGAIAWKEVKRHMRARNRRLGHMRRRKRKARAQYMREQGLRRTLARPLTLPYGEGH